MRESKGGTLMRNRCILTVTAMAMLFAVPVSLWAQALRVTPVAIYAEGVGQTQKTASPGCLTLSPDGRFLVAMRDSGDTVFIYARDAEDGKLRLMSKLQRSVSEPRRVAFTPDSKFLVVPEFLPRLWCFGLDERSGALTNVQLTENNKRNVVGMESPDACCVSPDGKSLYVLGRREMTLACFRLDSRTGQIEFDECLQSVNAGLPGEGLALPLPERHARARMVEGMFCPMSVACSPDGRHVLVGLSRKALSVFARDAATSRLTFVEQIGEHPSKLENNLVRISGIAFHQGGAYVSTCNLTGGLTLLRRDPESGSLHFIQAWVDAGVLKAPRDSIHMAEGLRSCSDIIWSKDGKWLFVGGSTDQAVVAFAFDAAGERLIPAALIRQGVENLSGLDLVNSVAVSPDGKFLYAASRDASAAVFALSVSDP